MSNQVADENKKRLVIECFNNIIGKETNQSKKLLLQSHLKRFSEQPKLQSLDPIFKLNILYRQALKLFSYEFNAWKNSFREVIKKFPQYDTINIEQFLLSFQSQLKFDMADFQRVNTIGAKYNKPEVTYKLEINKARINNNWSKEFVEEWRQRKQTMMKEAESRRLIAQSNPQIKKQEPRPHTFPSITGSIPQNPKAQLGFTGQQGVRRDQPIQNVESQLVQKSSQTTTKQPLQRNKPGPKPRKSTQNVNEDATISEDGYQNLKLKNISPFQSGTIKKEQLFGIPVSRDAIFTVKKNEVPQKKNRAMLIAAHLEGRKDLLFSPGGSRTIAEFLNAKLEVFMTNILEKTIAAAKLRNYNLSKNDAGDEFRYFSKQNKSLAMGVQIKVPKNVEISIVRYPSKLQIFSDMRIKQELEQDDIRRNLIRKRDVEKKKEDKILDYLLASRQAQSQGWQTRTEAQTQRLVISNNHVQFVLEEHQFFKDGIAAFKSYHY